MMIKAITFTADERIIKRARQKARRENKSLNDLYRQWLSWYAGEENKADDFRSLMNELGYVRAGHKFTRDEMDER